MTTIHFPTIMYIGGEMTMRCSCSYRASIDVSRLQGVNRTERFKILGWESHQKAFDRARKNIKNVEEIA